MTQMSRNHEGKRRRVKILETREKKWIKKKREGIEGGRDEGRERKRETEIVSEWVKLSLQPGKRPPSLKTQILHSDEFLLCPAWGGVPVLPRAKMFFSSYIPSLVTLQ